MRPEQQPGATAIGVSMFVPDQLVHLTAFPAPPATRWPAEVRLDRTAALNLTRQLAAALRYFGTTWVELYPTADDLPDETLRWSPTRR